VSSLSAECVGPDLLLKHSRGHWGIENRVHYIRDTTFDEDRCRARTGHGARVMATLRNAAVSVLRFAKADNIARATRYLNHHPAAAQRLIGLH
jgi:hypothetical protein